MIKTGLTGSDGREELLTEYLCDYPDCPNVATRVLGYAKEIGVGAAVCDEHAPRQLKPAGSLHPNIGHAR